MKRTTMFMAIAIALVLLPGTPAVAGWFDDTLKDALQGAGERGVHEAVDAGYEGAKGTGKQAVENASAKSGTSPSREEAAEPHGTPGEMREGQWEITMTIDMPGMPMAIPPQTYRSCLTRDNAVPRQENDGTECDYEELDNDGSTVKWKATCRSEDGIVSKSRGKIVYYGSSFKGETATETKDPDSGTMRMNNTMKGRYLGPCPD
ncbi:MAG: DUF3617 domain-containing protein [Desulfatibacillaceae bacterium]